MQTHHENSELWEAAYRIISTQILPNQLRTWIQPLKLIETEDVGTATIVRIEAANDFSAQWVRDNFKVAIESALGQVAGKSCQLQVRSRNHTTQTPHTPPPKSSFETNFDPHPATLDLARNPSAPPLGELGERDEKEEKNDNEVNEEMSFSEKYSRNGLPGKSASQMNFSHDQPIELNTAPLHSRIEPRIEAPRTSGSDRSQGQEKAHLDPRYTFRDFVVGASNQFTYSAAVAVAERPASQYNPFFIYSPPGLGKTHLLHAVGNHILSKKPDTRVCYISAESFVNELIESLQHHRMSQFRNKFRNTYDVLLIDDIQFIAGKTRSEEEFFHTFNALHSSKRQLVFTSDRPPKEIEGLEERIRTRFEWGLITDIQVPEIETRIAILKGKAERDDIYIPDEVATFIATHVKSNVRELEGLLIKLQAQASLSGAEISLEMARQELKNIVDEAGAEVTVDSIMSTVAKHFRVKQSDLRSTARTKNLALARQIAMYLIRKYTEAGFKEIGTLFRRDHSTVVHACRRIEEGHDKEPEVREAVETIQNHL